MARWSRQFHEVLNLSPQGREVAGSKYPEGPVEPDPRDPTMFQKARVRKLFHGTDTRHEVGDLLTPDGAARHLAELGASQSESRLYVTPDSEWAGAHGQHIYEVVPQNHGGDPTKMVRNTYGSNYITQSGLRVVRYHGPGDRSLLVS